MNKALYPDFCVHASRLIALVVDDSRFALLTESMLLKQLGYRVLTAESAKQALKILSKQHVDLVFTDINMPDMRGDELARQIQQEFPGLLIVAVTTACIEELQMFKETNFEMILRKPLTANMIRQAMRTCFQFV